MANGVEEDGVPSHLHIKAKVSNSTSLEMIGMIVPTSLTL